MPVPTVLFTDLMPVGVLHLDVILYRRKDWPAQWAPEAIWDHKDLREMDLTFRERNNDPALNAPASKSLDTFTLATVRPNYFGFNNCEHAVHNGYGLMSFRFEGKGDLGHGDNAAQYRRTIPTVEDIAWVLAHWRPRMQVGYQSAQQWWLPNGKDAAVFKGLLPSEIEKFEEAMELAKAIRLISPWMADTQRKSDA